MAARTNHADWLDHASSTIDLRKSRDRNNMDIITARAEHLVSDERECVLAMFRDGKPATDIARIRNEPPRAVRKTIRRAVARINDPAFMYVVRASPRWSPTKRRVAHAIFRAGRSIRQAADELNLSVHEVRRHRDAILALVAQDTRASTSPTPNREWRA